MLLLAEHLLFIASVQYCVCEDEGLFPWTEESHLERCDSLMELCAVSSERDSNSVLRWAEKTQGYYCSCQSSACYQPDETWSIRTKTHFDQAKNWDGKWSWTHLKQADVS